MDASGRGDDRRQEGVTQTLSLVTPAIFVNLLLSPLRKREVYVLMAQSAILWDFPHFEGEAGEKHG